MLDTGAPNKIFWPGKKATVNANAHSQTRAKALEQIVHDAYNRRTRATRYRVRHWAQLLKPVSRVITEVHAARLFCIIVVIIFGVAADVEHRRLERTKQNTAATTPLGGDGPSLMERGTRMRQRASERETWSPVRAKAVSSDPATSHAPRKHILAPDRITASLDCAQHAGWKQV
ncbi:hypothetical protein TRIATDRAFT_260435 [Trichoderma atroviride IMI 206040]|uniref:Uncharacterized protein n=1 Tax=Hypocrea atroviridis (strain ATCC 20476 / IMI 206040) TaxID=452589 RepID=G9PBT4_HYPAI|nr:uncharacterized protein TRIATDRAFT_260435 [Trichoderma atroviride IMI 206040]EHK39828.1 hypothetical protein TRIATDRAFT_260435 [Trichoderma atroviride IMI 206040]